MTASWPGWPSCDPFRVCRRNPPDIRPDEPGVMTGMDDCRLATPTVVKTGAYLEVRWVDALNWCFRVGQNCVSRHVPTTRLQLVINCQVPENLVLWLQERYKHLCRNELYADSRIHKTLPHCFTPQRTALAASERRFS